MGHEASVPTNVPVPFSAPALLLRGAVEHAGHPAVGRVAGEVAGVEPLGVPIVAGLPEGEASLGGVVLIGFSTPASTPGVVRGGGEAGVAVVVGTTGLDAGAEAGYEAKSRALDATIVETKRMLAEAGKLPVSEGVNLLFAIAVEVAAKLGPEYDIDLLESHHRHKKDAPSGTALGLLEAICERVGVKPGEVRKDGRSGDDPRPPVPEGASRPVQIGMHSLRLGGEVGRHTAFFASPDEQFELTHRATSRDVFARGALRAAAWLADKPARRNTMRDVLGL